MDGGLHLRLLRLKLRDQTRPLRPLCGILCHGPWMSTFIAYLRAASVLCNVVLSCHMLKCSVSILRIRDHPLFSDGYRLPVHWLTFDSMTILLMTIQLLAMWQLLFVREQVWKLLMLNPSMSCFLLAFVSLGCEFCGTVKTS